MAGCILLLSNTVRLNENALVCSDCSLPWISFKVASKVIGTKMNSLELLFNRQVINKAMSIRSDAAHPLNAESFLQAVVCEPPVPQKTEFVFCYFLYLSLNSAMENSRKPPIGLYVYLVVLHDVSMLSCCCFSMLCLPVLY